MASQDEDDRLSQLIALQQDMTLGVKQMSAATQALRTLIEKEYPTRRELEARFVEKIESRRTLIIAVVVGLVAALLSFIGTVATVSTCFLGGANEDHPAFCSLMPGYGDTIREQEEFFKDYQRLKEQVARRGGSGR